MVRQDTPLRRARCRRGLSQEDLEREAAVSQTFISGLERGHCPQSIRAALRVARALGTTVEQLFGDYASVPSSGRGRRRVYKDTPCPGATSATEAA